MLVSIRDCRHSKKDRQWIQDVYPEYLDALSDLNTGLFSVLGTSNPHQDEIFANWFANDHSHPLVISKGADSVGFALNDFSSLRYLQRLNAEQPDGGQRIDLIPEPDDPKDLFGGLSSETARARRRRFA